MAIPRNNLKPQVDNFGGKINTPQGKGFIAKNGQKVTKEPTSRPRTPEQTGKVWKQTKK